jgi:hypothetical protein
MAVFEKCKNCLKLEKDRCIAFTDPCFQWRNGKCFGYTDDPETMAKIFEDIYQYNLERGVEVSLAKKAAEHFRKLTVKWYAHTL